LGIYAEKKKGNNLQDAMNCVSTENYAH